MSRTPRDAAAHAARPAHLSHASVATFRRLSRLELAGHPVLSVYLDLEPARFATAAARKSEHTALLTQARRAADGDREIHADVDRVERLLASQPDLEQGAGALGIFSAHDAGVFEVVTLPRAVEPLVAVDRVPWLVPLATAIPIEDVAVVVVDRRRARLLRDDDGRLTEIEAVADPLHGRHDQGGWSQARWQRAIEEEVAVHARHVAGVVDAAHRQAPFGQLVVVASSELWPVLRDAMPADRRGQVIGVVEADLGGAPIAELARAVRPVLEQARDRHVDEVLARVSDEMGVEGAAAAGLAQVLPALAEDRVAALVVDPAAAVRALLCPRCAALTAPPGSTCGADGTALVEVDAIEHAACRAGRQDAEVLPTAGDRIGALGAIAALLRW